MTLELENVSLEMVARGEPLQATIERVCSEVEALVPSIVCSVLLVDRHRSNRDNDTIAAPVCEHVVAQGPS